MHNKSWRLREEISAGEENRKKACTDATHQKEVLYEREYGQISNFRCAFLAISKENLPYKELPFRNMLESGLTTQANATISPKTIRCDTLATIIDLTRRKPKGTE